MRSTMRLIDADKLIEQILNDDRITDKVYFEELINEQRIFKREEHDMYRVSDDIEIIRSDDIDASGVYIGGVDDLDKAQLKWREEDWNEWDAGLKVEVLTLREIAEQLSDQGIITVMTHSPLHGEIYQYGNYGPEWWRIGDTIGYA